MDTPGKTTEMQEDGPWSRITSFSERVTDAIVSREYRPLLHLLSISVIVVAACLLFYQHFSNPGILMHVDMTWATSLSRINSIYRNTWLPYGSGYNVFNLLMLLWQYPLLLVAQALHISTAHYLLILFIGTFSLAGVSMYAFAYRTIGSINLKDTWKYAAFAGAVVAALVYMYNPWSLGHMWPYYMYPAYAMLPLVVIAMIKSFDAPSPKYIIILALLIALSTNAPVNVVWLWFLVFGYAIYYVAMHKFDRGTVKRSLKVTGAALALYFALDTTWILPYLGERLASKAVLPSYTVTQSMLDGLSQNNTMLNNLRLTAGWAYPVNTNPTNNFALILSFVLPLLAILGFIVLYKKWKSDSTVIYIAMISLATTVFATGTSFFLRWFYSKVVLSTASLGWLIRVPDRWLAFLPLFYATMIGALVTVLLRKKPEPGPEGLDAGGEGEMPG